MQRTIPILILLVLLGACEDLRQPRWQTPELVEFCRARGYSPDDRAGWDTCVRDYSLGGRGNALGWQHRLFPEAGPGR